MSLARLLGLGMCWAVLAANAPAAPDGAELYRAHCAACHQTQGHGGIGLPLSSVTLANVSDDYLTRTIRLGRPGRIMPAFENLSDAQVAAIVGYIRSWYGDPGMTFAPVPIRGDVAAGRLVYAQHCTKCHGEDGSGEGQGTGVTLARERSFLIMPPAINNPGFLAAAPDALLRHTIAEGREGTAMRGYGERLSQVELDNLVAFVRSLSAKTGAESESPSEGPSHLVESSYDFDTTVNNVHRALTGSNFRLFPDRYLEQGLIDEFSHNLKQVSIRFCNFNKLYNLLNVEPRLGVVLPCRITVLERADGRVLLVAPNMRTISRWFNNDELDALATAMNNMILEVLDEATL